MYYVMVLGQHELVANRWLDSGEGPWSDVHEAITFADAECGAPWIVVDQHGAPQHFGDNRGVYGGSCSYRPIPRTTLMERLDG